MRLASVLILASVLGVGALCIGHAGAAPIDKATKAIAGDNNAFAIDLYGELSKAEGNLFFSPFSISTALGMTYAGAKGQTADQMAKTLHFDLPSDRLHAAMGGLVRQLNEAGKQKSAKLIVANALWGHQDFQFLKEFLAVNNAHYGAGLRRVDFTSPETARATINGWVADQTNKLIPELIPPGILNPLTRLVLTNAIYFKGTWLTQFDPKRTRELPFTLATGEKVQAPMMRQTARFGYAEAKDWQALELPYKGRELSMVVVLPRAHDGLPALEKIFTARFVTEELRPRGQKVVVMLPKFKLESSFGLKPTLTALGMRDAFTMRADFSGMTGRSDLFISAVVHKAVVDVNEEGTEAAAATGVVMELKSVMPRPPKVFRADHPFLFLIRHRPSGSILFLGRVMNPKG